MTSSSSKSTNLELLLGKFHLQLQFMLPLRHFLIRQRTFLEKLATFCGRNFRQLISTKISHILSMTSRLQMVWRHAHSPAPKEIRSRLLIGRFCDAWCGAPLRSTWADPEGRFVAPVSPEDRAWSAWRHRRLKTAPQPNVLHRVLCKQTKYWIAYDRCAVYLCFCATKRWKTGRTFSRFVKLKAIKKLCNIQ